MFVARVRRRGIAAIVHPQGKMVMVYLANMKRQGILVSSQ
jgi:hypothetical protein